MADQDETDPPLTPFTTARDEDDSVAFPLMRGSKTPPTDDVDRDDFVSTLLGEVTVPTLPDSVAGAAFAQAVAHSEVDMTSLKPQAFQEAAVERTLREQRPAKATSRAPALLLALGLVAAVGVGGTFLARPRPTGSLAAKAEPQPAARPPVPANAPVAQPALAPPVDAKPEATLPNAEPEATLPSAEPEATLPSAEPSREPPSTAPSAPPVPAAPSPPFLGPAILLDNPFRTPDANLPSCQQLAQGAAATTPDTISEASAHWAIARKSIVKGDIEGASREMCIAAAINPQSPANEGLARLHALANSPAQALLWVTKALALAPNHRELLNLRGDILSQLGEQSKAETDWLAAMGIAEDDVKRRNTQSAAWVNEAREGRARGDVAKAEQLFRRALGFHSKSLLALTGMAELLLQRKLYDHAGTFAARGLAEFDAVPELHLVLGDVALAKNDLGRARSSFERALAIRHDFWPAKNRLHQLTN